LRDAIEHAQIVIEAAGISPADVDASSFPTFGSLTTPEVRFPAFVQLTFGKRAFQVLPGRVVLQTTPPIDDDLSPEMEAITTFVENYVGAKASWKLIFVVQMRCPVPEDRMPEEWLQRLVQADAIAAIQAPSPFDVSLDIPFPFASGRGVIRIERSRLEPLNGMFFLVQYVFSDPTIAALREFGSCVSEASDLADRVMSLVQTEVSR
jgi:hypothetical protein